MESTRAVGARDVRVQTPRLTAQRPRPRAVCPVCQHHKPVRVSGVMAKHRTYWGTWCPGQGATPVPVPVREPDYTPAGYFDGRLLDRWDFLSMPLLLLLHTTRAEVREIAEPSFAGSIRPASGQRSTRWIVYMPVGGDILDHDLTVRGLLAAAHGVDVGDWPVGMSVRSI